MLKNTVWAALFLLSSGTASSAVEIWVEAGWTCADWAGERQTKSAQYLQQHLVGILNGFVISTGRDFWREGGQINSEQAFYWMDRYCEQNPLGMVALGAKALADERLGKGWNVAQQ